MYQEISYEIVIFDHILGGWYMNIYGRRLLRPERSSAARRCACFDNRFIFDSFYFIGLFFLFVLQKRKCPRVKRRRRRKRSRRRSQILISICFYYGNRGHYGIEYVEINNYYNYNKKIL